jgi:lipopolysaccharide export system permease protein
VRILSRYFLASYLNLFSGILAASLVVAVIVEMLLHFEEMMSQGESFGGVASYLFVRVPFYYLGYLIPVSSFAAAFLCLGLPARWSEITAVKAGGISPRRIALPVLLAAAVLSAAALLVNETLVLSATREWHRTRSPGREITYRQGSFWYHRGDEIYNVLEADRDTRTLHGVRVFQLTPEGRLLRSIYADRVRIEGENWHFLDATFRSFDPHDPAAPPTLERSAETVIAVARERDLALIDASATTLSLSELSEFIDARSRAGRNTERYRGLLHARLAEPLGVFVFALLAIPIGIGVDRHRNIAVAALHGITVVGIFYTLKTVTSILAAGGMTSAVISHWMLITLFAGFGAWRLARTPS